MLIISIIYYSLIFHPLNIKHLLLINGSIFFFIPYIHHGDKGDLSRPVVETPNFNVS